MDEKTRMIDWAALTKAVMPVSAVCCDCKMKWSTSLARDNAMLHSAETKHYVWVESRPLTLEEQGRQKPE